MLLDKNRNQQKLKRAIKLMALLFGVFVFDLFDFNDDSCHEIKSGLWVDVVIGVNVGKVARTCVSFAVGIPI